jgi:hypothetical protein
MRDEGELVDPNQPLSRSERAVLYTLRRIRLDANLRYYMLHTEAFQLLCEAESDRGHSFRHPVKEFASEDELNAWFRERGAADCADGIMAFYSKPAEHCKDDVADVIRLEREVEQCLTKFARGITANDEAKKPESLPEPTETAT